MNIASVDDIGNGNKIILNIQFDLGALNNTGAIANRNSYLGIEGGWGSVQDGHERKRVRALELTSLIRWTARWASAATFRCSAIPALHGGGLVRRR